MNEMKRLIVTLVCVLPAILLATLDISLNQHGGVRVEDSGANLNMRILHQGWKGQTMSMRSDFTFPDAATGTTTFDLVDSKDKTVHAHGRTTLVSTSDARAVISTTMTSCRDQKPQEIILVISLPCKNFAGGTWKTSSGEDRTFAKTFNRSGKGFHGTVSWIEFSPIVGKSFRLTFPTPMRIKIQDDRAWNVDAFSIRVRADGGKTFNIGDQRTFMLFVSSPDGVSVDVDRPIVLKANDEWIPLDYLKDIEEGSALDFSKQGLHDAPAGKYGWLKNVNGHFEFENLPGKKQRFYGANLCYDANFPDHSLADRVVTRLVRLGYNSVRIHHYERGVVKGMKDALTLNAEQMDRLDYLLAKCFEKGIYATTDLFTSRPVTWRAIGTDRDGYIPQQIYKNLIPIHEGAYQNWEAFAKNFLTHVNKYTGRAYKDEPALPLIALINEGALTMCWEKIRSEPILKKAWADWLAEQRKLDPNFAKGCDNPEIVPNNSAVLFAFMAHNERRLVVRQRAFLKELGVKALLSNQNCGGRVAPIMAVRDELYDYVDDHFYVDHPSFLATPWALPSRCGNHNPTLTKVLPPAEHAFVRIPNKPFCITEWNFSAPGMFRGVGGIMTGALSALQDWDGLWRFDYASNTNALENRMGTLGYFSVANDPLGLAGDRASICLFLRGDLAPLTDMVVNRVTPDTLSPTNNKAVSIVPPWHNAAWQIRTGTSVAPIAGVPTFNLKDQVKRKDAPVAIKPNPSIAFDRTRGSFRISTPKTAGGFVPSGAIDAGVVSFDAGDVATTLWVSSLDGKAIDQSSRMLLTHLTDVQANGNVFADKERRTLLKWGKYPPIVRAGTGYVSLALKDPETYTVWALEMTGQRLEKIPCVVKDGKLTFTVSVKGSNGARMFYEIVSLSHAVMGW